MKKLLFVAFIFGFSFLLAQGNPFTEIRDRANHTKCKSNLRQLGISLILFMESKGKGIYYPLPHKTKFITCLYNSEIITDKTLFCCPATNLSTSRKKLRKGTEDCTSYEGTTIPVYEFRADFPILWDKKGNHKEKRNVVFLDSSVRDFSEEEFQKLMEKERKLALENQNQIKEIEAKAKKYFQEEHNNFEITDEDLDYPDFQEVSVGFFQRARTTKCKSNLRQLAIAQVLFVDFQGKGSLYLPADKIKFISGLFQSQVLLEEECYLCPATNDTTNAHKLKNNTEDCTSYEGTTIPIWNGKDADRIPIMWDKKGNHLGFRNVVFLDSSCQSITDEDFQKLMEWNQNRFEKNRERAEKVREKTLKNFEQLKK